MESEKKLLNGSAKMHTQCKKPECSFRGDLHVSFGSNRAALLGNFVKSIAL